MIKIKKQIIKLFNTIDRRSSYFNHMQYFPVPYKKIKYTKYDETDVFEKEMYHLDFEKQLNDDEILVDVDNFQLFPYLKYLIDPRSVTDEKDFFPRMVILFTTGFLIHIFIKNIFFYVFLDDQIKDKSFEKNNQFKIHEGGPGLAMKVEIRQKFHYNFDLIQKDILNSTSEFIQISQKIKK